MGEVAPELYTQDGTVDIKGNPALKQNTGNWRACPYIFANECFERLAYYGMSTNLVNFMKDRMGMANAVTANNVTNWSGTCYITPLIGAFLADAYLGRFWTIASFMVIYIIAMTAGKEAVKMASWLGRRSSNTLRMVAVGSNKSG